MIMHDNDDDDDDDDGDDDDDDDDDDNLCRRTSECRCGSGDPNRPVQHPLPATDITCWHAIMCPYSTYLSRALLPFVTDCCALPECENKGHTLIPCA